MNVQSHKYKLKSTLLFLAFELVQTLTFLSSPDDHSSKGSGLAPWPTRLTSPPPRLADFVYSSDMFEKDTEMWRKRVENYWDILSPKITSNTIRNVMDMKANLGSCGAALKSKDVWVMNVVPEDGPNTLKLIYDRGLLGSIHNPFHKLHYHFKTRCYNT